MLIAVDHGNKLTKVVNHAPFISGLQESDSLPFGGETLKYREKYYTLSEKRIPYHRDKTEDERFFVLTLFAIAYEIQTAKAYSTTCGRYSCSMTGARPRESTCCTRAPASNGLLNDAELRVVFQTLDEFQQQ